MQERIQRAGYDSDTALLDALMACGEFATKLTVSVMLAAMIADPERSKYRLTYDLVRSSSSPGSWATTLNKILIASHLLPHEARPLLPALTKYEKNGTLVHDCVSSLVEAIRLFIHREPEPIHARGARLQDWFDRFAELRNKIRHGAPLPSAVGAGSIHLRRSVDSLLQLLPITRLNWSYLHQNLSGKYRVTPLHSPAYDSAFDDLKRHHGPPYIDGIYVHIGEPRLLELVHSDPDLTDFFCANGDFKEKTHRYDLLSYITGNTADGDGAAYATPPGRLPAAATQGLETLDIHGESFSNVPPLSDGYVARSRLEQELVGHLQDTSRRPIITLHGRGGIGKTSLALRSLQQVCASPTYTAVVWFSARDVELHDSGPKAVQAHLVDEREIAKEFCRLLPVHTHGKDDFVATDHFASQLARSDIGPLLLVFDNFETVKDQRGLYLWLDRHIRPPNKILITTRHRAFNGDFQILVEGMEFTESRTLMRQTATHLGVSEVFTEEYIEQLHGETGGHPYVIKVVVGQIANSSSKRRKLDVTRLVADRGDILDALFDRSFSELSAAARRVFLTVCRWKSVMYVLGIKAVLARSANTDILDVDEAIDELERLSLLEFRSSDADGEQVLAVPLAAAEFGRKKLRVDPFRSAVEADFRFLQMFGATNITEISSGFQAKARQLFRSASAEIHAGTATIDDFREVLRFVAMSYPPAWMLMAELLEETAAQESDSGGLDVQAFDMLREAVECVRHFIEVASDDDQLRAWKRHAKISAKIGDWRGQLQSYAAIASASNGGIEEVSQASSEVNRVLASYGSELEPDEKQVLVESVIASFEAVPRLHELADAHDWSRLAWLHLNLGAAERARECTLRGLEQDPENRHVVKLAERLGIHRPGG